MDPLAKGDFFIIRSRINFPGCISPNREIVIHPGYGVRIKK
jgi:hypothetical protein